MAYAIGLDEKVVLVTGRAGGIGLASAKALARAGATVFILDRDRERADEAAASLEREGASVLAVQADVADEISVDKAFAEIVDRAGHLDILVNWPASPFAPRPPSCRSPIGKGRLRQHDR